jgi:deoxyguanosine kinase
MVPAHRRQPERVQSMSEPRYIAVEGPIGVGATSLATRLADRVNAQLILDPGEKNPFLERFYGDPVRYALPTQLSFMRSRWEQQAQILAPSDEPIVSDYLFARDALFARLTLTDEELGLYGFCAGQLGAPTKPDLVIYLQAEPDVLMKRIATRGRPYEESLGEDYLSRVVNAYNHYFFHYTETSLLVINTAEIDFVNNEQDLDRLFEEIDRTGGGTRYYVARNHESDG